MDELLEFNDLKGLPRQYKRKALIYPIKIKDALEFYDSISILNISKNETDNVEIMQMSYLKFLIFISTGEGNSFVLDKLLKLLQLIFQSDDLSLDVKENERYVIRLSDGIEISEYDFGKIRTIISEQNMVDLDDDDVNPEVKAKMREAREFMAKRGSKPASFSQRILAYQYEMKLDLDTILNMTLYQFNRSLETINHVKNADLLQQARYGGMVTFKNEELLPTWLSAIEKSDDPLILDANQLKNSLSETFN